MVFRHRPFLVNACQLAFPHAMAAGCIDAIGELVTVVVVTPLLWLYAAIYVAVILARVFNRKRHILMSPFSLIIVGLVLLLLAVLVGMSLQINSSVKAESAGLYRAMVLLSAGRIFIGAKANRPWGNFSSLRWRSRYLSRLVYG